MPSLFTWLSGCVINIRDLLINIKGFFRGVLCLPRTLLSPLLLHHLLRLPTLLVRNRRGGVVALGSRLQDTDQYIVRERQELAYQRGEIGSFSGGRVAIRNRCYVVLRGPDTEVPFFTWDLATHQAAVYSPRGTGISRISIPHGFPSWCWTSWTPRNSLMTALPEGVHTCESSSGPTRLRIQGY